MLRRKKVVNEELSERMFVGLSVVNSGFTLFHQIIASLSVKWNLDELI